MKYSSSRYIFANFKNRISHTIKNPRFITHYISKIIQYKFLQDVDGYLISYPKSGRTWLQRIILEAASQKFTLKSKAKDIFELSHFLTEFPVIVATHGGSCWEEDFKIYGIQDLKKINNSKYLKSKIVFMHRDPRDVLVSQYYHMKYRTNIAWITKSELINSPWIGLEKQITFLNQWCKLKEENPGSIQFISYEELQKDSLTIVKRVSAFWELGLSETDLQFGIENAAFEKMKSEESSKSETPWNYTPEKTRKNSFHARSGQIGEYKNFFTNDEIHTINQIVKNNLNSSLLDLYKIE